MQVSSAGLKMFHTYEQVLSHYESVVPYRSGNDKGKRPLGNNRRYTSLQIDKYTETNAVALSLYGKDIVTFFPSGRIEVCLGGYDSVSTRQFITAVTPWSCEIHKGTTYLVTAAGHYVFPNSQYVLILEDSVVLNPQQEVIYLLNRKALNVIRDKYKPFREYVKSMGSITNCITTEEFNAANVPDGWNNREGRVQRLNLPTASVRYYHGVAKPLELIHAFVGLVNDAVSNNDLEKMYHAYMLLGISALDWNYYDDSFKSKDRTSPIAKQCLEYFDEILKYVHRDTVFTKDVLPLGKKSSNDNRKYFNY